MTDEQRDLTTTESEDVTASTTEDPQYGVGPFSIREVAIGAVWLVAFILSFVSITTVGFNSVWTSGLLWVLTIGVPTVAVFLIALRRLSPQGIRRVGSLGIDQFASVAFSVATVLWIQLLWETVAIAIDGGPWVRNWVTWIMAVLMLAGVVLTVFAPLIPPLSEDFRGRREIPAHRNARPIRPVSPRPAPVRPEPAVATEIDEAPAVTADETDARTDADFSQTAVWEPVQTRDTYEPVTVVDTIEEEPVAEPLEDDVEDTDTATGTPVSNQAFWALAPEERDVVDEIGIPLFRIGPTAWALVIEDRGEVFVIRHEDGRVGYLHDVSDVTRG
ncbi:hypothetical protein [Microbacterium aurantiacum]|uniref:hypothetical protein n=1 Tax=Microbacterium aurantiacum TaxID=162393 RepID=UPI001F16ECEC|nr:hypothetical protein [Microbacterium aurantiacum]